MSKLDSTSREHLRRFMKWLFTGHFSDSHQMSTPEGVIWNALNDQHFADAHPNTTGPDRLQEIIEKYEEWLKLGEPSG